MTKIITSKSCSEIPLIIGGNLFGYSCSQVQAFDVLDAAHNAGIRRVDTADVYSDGMSEIIIGQWLKTRQAQNEWCVYTKIGHQPGTEVSYLGSRTVMRDRTLKSLDRLKLKSVFRQQLHWPDPKTPVSETIETATELSELGYIEGFGISNIDLATNLGQTWFAEIRRVASVQVFGNWIVRDQLDQFNSHLSNSQELLVYGVLGRGVLSGNYLEPVGEEPNSRASKSKRVSADSVNKSLADLILKAKSVAASFGTDLIGLALEEVWSRGALPIVGCRTPRHVEEAVNRFEMRSQHTLDALHYVQRIASAFNTDAWDLGSPNVGRP